MKTAGKIDWVERHPHDEYLAEWQGTTAHIEHLGDAYWFAAVSLNGLPGQLSKPIFHSANHDVILETEAAARAVCELVMRAVAAGVDVAALFERPE
jgi:hypothetical protein